MATSVREFQQDILNGIDLSRLLNEAYAISIEIKDKKMEKWCHCEISGYDNIDNVPEYRKISVRFVADGTFRKNIPVEIPTGYDFFGYHIVTNPISSLIKFTKQTEHQAVSFEFDNKINKDLCELYNCPLDFTFKQQAAISQLSGIEAKVKEKIINWGMHLKPEPLEKASRNVKANLQTINNYNISGNVNNSQIQQGNNNSKQKRNFIKDLIGNLFGSLFGHLFK